MFGETDSTVASSIMDMIRFLVTAMDRPAYGLLTVVYQLFFNVASAEIISGSMVAKFYGRVQLIIGVFMLFQLAMIIIKGIMNPDAFTDSKSGAGNVITRIVVSMFLLTLIVPINIPNPRNEYETKINDNGLLFGTLYSLQSRILKNHTLGKLIIGENGENKEIINWDSDDEQDDIARSSRVLASSILRVFYRINLKPDYKTMKECQVDNPAKINNCRMCGDLSEADKELYLQEDQNPQLIISLIDKKCPYESKGIIDRLTGDSGERYKFVINPFISAITAIVLVFILLSFTIDIAVRAVKLAVLRLIAPIPIISYMDPKGSKDNAFNAWLKSLGSTYLDLFIRIGVVYFVVYLVQSILTNGIVLTHGSGLLGGFTTVMIIIGLFVFAKQAPKFFKQALGLKDNGGKLFSGFGEMLGVGAVGAGAVSGGLSGAAAKFQSTRGSNIGKRLVATLGGGVTGALGGGVNAGRTFLKQKDTDPHAIMNANRAYAMKRYSNASDESTPFGRFAAGSQANLGLKNKFQKMEDKIKYENFAKDSLGRMMDSLKSNGDYHSVYKGKDIIDNFGNKVLEQGQHYSLKDFNDKLSRVTSSGNEGLIRAVDDATKAAQNERLTHLRTTFTGTHAEARQKLQAEIDRCVKLPSNHQDYKKYTSRDLVVLDEAYNIYDVANLYPEETFFSAFKGKKFNDKSLKLGDFKGAASNAGEDAANTKAGSAYAQAKANAQRAEDSKKK